MFTLGIFSARALSQWVCKKSLLFVDKPWPITIDEKSIVVKYGKTLEFNWTKRKNEHFTTKTMAWWKKQ